MKEAYETKFHNHKHIWENIKFCYQSYLGRNSSHLKHNFKRNMVKLHFAY